MRYLLDTNVLLHMLRDSVLWKHIQREFDLINPDQHIYISIVTFAEITSLSKQLGWGAAKQKKLKSILNQIPLLYINKQIANYYVSLDTFSQGKHTQLKLPLGMSARNMGKNDLWIAATAMAAQAELLTTDADFYHLNEVFLSVRLIKPL